MSKPYSKRDTSSPTTLEVLETMDMPFGEIAECITELTKRIDILEELIDERISVTELDTVYRKINELKDRRH